MLHIASMDKAFLASTCKPDQPPPHPHKIGKRPPLFPREGQGGKAEYIFVIKTCINMNVVGIMHQMWCKSKPDLRFSPESKILQHTKIYCTEYDRKQRVGPTSVT